MTALLYHVTVQRVSTTKVKITLTPNWLGRFFKRRVRTGPAKRAIWRYKDEFENSYEDQVVWLWSATDRRVGRYIERYIEAAPILTIEDMSVEQLLLP